MNKSMANTSGHSSSAYKASSTTSKSSHHRSKNINQNEIPLMNKKVTISQEKLLALTRKVYNNSGADNKCEAKSLHLLCRAVNAQFASSNDNQTPNSLYTLQSKFEDKFNPTSEAWKHALILVISYLKKYQMELSLATVIVETPKEIEVRNYNTPGIVKIPFPISMKRFTSPESVSRIFNDLMNTKKSIQNKTFNDKLNEFIENMEMEDFWQRNPLLVFSSPYVNTLSATQTDRSSAIPTQPKISSAANKSSISQNKAKENINNEDNANYDDEYDDNANDDNVNDDTATDNRTNQINSESSLSKKKKSIASSSSKKGTKRKKKAKKKKELN